MCEIIEEQKSSQLSLDFLLSPFAFFYKPPWLCLLSLFTFLLSSFTFFITPLHFFIISLQPFYNLPYTFFYNPPSLFLLSSFTFFITLYTFLLSLFTFIITPPSLCLLSPFTFLLPLFIFLIISLHFSIISLHFFVIPLRFFYNPSSLCVLSPFTFFITSLHFIFNLSLFFFVFDFPLPPLSLFSPFFFSLFFVLCIFPPSHFNPPFFNSPSLHFFSIFLPQFLLPSHFFPNAPSYFFIVSPPSHFIPPHLFIFIFPPLPFFLVFSSDIRETQVLKFEVQNRVNFGCAIGCSAKMRYSGHLFSPFKAVWSLYDLPAPLSPNVKECRKLTEADTMRLFIAAYLCASLSLLYLWHGSPLRAMLHFHKQEAYMVGLWRKWRVDEKKGKGDKRK